MREMKSLDRQRCVAHEAICELRHSAEAQHPSQDGSLVLKLLGPNAHYPILLASVYTHINLLTCEVKFGILPLMWN